MFEGEVAKLWCILGNVVSNLVMVLREGLQNVGLPGVVAVGVLQPLQQPLLEHQDGHPQLVPQELNTSDVNNDVHRLGQQLQRELRLQQIGRAHV